MTSESRAAQSLDVVLRDGSTVHLRPIRPEDRAQLGQLYDQMSQESRYLRFFAMAKIDPRQLSRLAAVDDRDQICLVADAGGRIIADARYVRDPEDPQSAEV